MRLGERHAQAHHFIAHPVQSILLTLFFGLALLLDFLLAPLLGLGGLRSIRHTEFIHNIFTSHLSLAPRSKAFLAAMLILQSLLLCQHLLFALPLVFLMLPLPRFVNGGKLTAAEQNGIAVMAEGGGEEERVSRRSTEDVIGAEDAIQVTSQQRQSLCQPTLRKAGMCVCRAQHHHDDTPVLRRDSFKVRSIKVRILFEGAFLANVAAAKGEAHAGSRRRACSGRRSAVCARCAPSPTSPTPPSS